MPASYWSVSLTIAKHLQDRGTSLSTWVWNILQDTSDRLQHSFDPPQGRLVPAQNIFRRPFCGSRSWSKLAVAGQPAHLAW